MTTKKQVQRTGQAGKTRRPRTPRGPAVIEWLRRRWGEADPFWVEAARARTLAAQLERWARQLVSEQTPAGERERIAEKVRELDRTWTGLAARRPADRDSRAAELIARVCRDLAANVRAWPAVGVTLADPIERATEMAIGVLSDYLPEHAKALGAHRAMVAALIAGYGANRGGRGRQAPVSVDAALEALLGALRMRVEGSSVRRSSARRRKPPPR